MSKLHPLAFAPVKVWFNLIKNNKRLSVRRFTQFIMISFASLILSPFRFIEGLIFSSRIAGTTVHPSPVFILGHWRSGTTYLQTLFSKDPNLGYLCGYQAFMPGLELLNIKIIYKFLDLVVPRKRDMDNMPRGLAIPEEEEFALTATSEMGTYHSLWFPHNESYFRKYNLFESVSDKEMEQWNKNYLHLLKKIVLFTGKERLMLKNPPHTARIKVLLELFPQAKFINIYRNPYDVYLSMRNMYEKSICPLFLQEMSDAEVDEKIFTWYEKVMRKFMEEVNLIPQENYLSVRYEDLERAPYDYMKKIYQYFGLDFNSADEHIKHYLESVKNYEKNKFKLSPKQVKLINTRWKFAFDYFKYEMKSH